MWYVFDGMDGSGKSTAASMAADELRSEGRRVMVLTHPSRDTRMGGLELRLLTKEGRAAETFATVLYVADVVRSLRIMRRHRGEYDDFVFVRYSMAAAYLPDGLYRLAYRVIEFVLPTPDRAVLVDTSPDLAMERIRGRGDALEVFETEERLTRVRRRMLDISDGWVVLTNGDGVEGLRGQVLSRVLGDRSPDDAGNRLV